MRFQIETQILKQALDKVNHATANISTTPILENILIKVNYQNIVFTSNNLETAVEHIVDSGVNIESEGSFCVPSKIFTNYIGLVEDDRVHLELLSNNSLEIKTESSKVKIKGNEAQDFPIIPNIKEVSSFSLPSKVIKTSIEKTLFSAAEWNIRPNLAGIFVNISSKTAHFATTDSFRLSEYTIKWETNVWEDFSQIIPSKTAHQLKSMLGDEKQDVKIIIWENQIAFLFENTKFYSRLLSGKFPDYSVFFPTSYNTKSVINKMDLVNGLKKINLLSKETNYSIKMSFWSESGILIETSWTQSGEAFVQLVWSIEWEDAIIGLNSEYFLEALWVIDTTHIALSFESPLSPILITGIEENKKNESLKHIIMPLKI